MDVYNKTITPTEWFSWAQDANNKEDEDIFIKNFVSENEIIYNNNQKICKLDWDGIDELVIWEHNRPIDDEWVKSLEQSMIKDYETDGKFDSSDPIHLGKKIDGKYYILDGQHRIKAYNNLHSTNNYGQHKILIIIWSCIDTTNGNDYFLDKFKKINNRKPVDIEKLQPDKINDLWNLMNDEFSEGIEKGFPNNKIKSIWGKQDKNGNIKRPYINSDIFVNKIRENEYFNNNSIEDTMSRIIEINDMIKDTYPDERVRSSITPPGLELNKKIIASGFYLCWDSQLNWIDDIDNFF